MKKSGPLVVFLAFAGFGLWNLAPSVTVGDSGEFITAGATLSLPHPPSYPLYGLAGKAAGTLFSLGNWGYRVNLLSLLCAALALALLWDLGARCGLGLAGRLLSAGLLGAAPLLLYHSFVAEVFTLNLLFGVAGLWLLALPLPPLRLAAAGGLWLGLGMGNHHTLVLALPALALALLRVCQGRGPAALRSEGGVLAAAALAASGRRGLFLRCVVWAAGFFLLGFAVYLYLPLRSMNEPPLDWGHPAGWKAVWHVILRRDYGSFSLTVGEPFPRTLVNEASQLLRWLNGMLAQIGWPGAVLAAAGFRAWESPRPGRATLLLFLFFTGPFFLLLGNPPFNAELEGALPRFYLLSLVPAALAAGRGADWLATRTRAGWALLLLPAYLLVRGAPSWAARWDLIAYDYGRSVLKSLPPGAAFIMDGGDDTFYSLAFLHFVEGRRQDLALHDRGGLVYRHPYGPDFRRLNRDDKELRRRMVEGRLAGERPLYYSTMNPQVLPGRALVPVGLVQRTVPGSRERSAGAPGPHRSEERAPADAGDAALGAERSGAAAPDALVTTQPLWPFYVLRVPLGLLAHHYRYRALAPYFHYARGLTEAAAGRQEQAALSWKRAWDLGADAIWLPGNLSFALHTQGYAASSRGDWKTAEAWYRLLIRLLPAEAGGWLNLGVSLERQGRFAEAEEAERRAAQLAPSDPGTHYSLGALYWKQEQWEKAAASFRRYNELNPGDEKGVHFLLKAEEKMKGGARRAERSEPEHVRPRSGAERGGRP